MNKKIRGIQLALLGGIFWGFSGACGQFLFEHCGAAAQWVSTWRLFFSGLLIMLIALPKERGSIFKVFSKENIIPILFFSFVSVMGCQYSYFMAIYNSNSATATVLEYFAPALVMVYTCVRSKKLPSVIQFIALIFALLGVFMMSTGGNIHSLAISDKALFWGIMSGICYGIYTIQSPKLSSNIGILVMLAWGNLIGSLPLIAVNIHSVFTYNLDVAGLLAFLGTTVIGSILSFGIYIKGCQLAGSVTGSLCACIEPVASAIIAYLWLGTKMSFTDIIGLILIVATVVILTLDKNNSSEKCQ